MKAPLQALLLAPQYAAAAASGDKCVSIRAGLRDYQAGQPIALCVPDLSWCAMARVTGVQRATLATLPLQDLIDDGFESRPDALAVLRRFYPDLTMESEVTALHWVLEQ